MTRPTIFAEPDELDKAIRRRVLKHAQILNAEIMARFATADTDLDSGEHRAALGALDGIERQVNALRSILLLLQ